MKLGNTTLIPQNVALAEATGLVIATDSGKEMCKVPLGNLALPDMGTMLYSFGAVSDVHVSKSDSETDALCDLREALQYLTGVENVAFVCICGDLTTQGTADNLAQYKAYVDAYSPNTPVYAIAGNHEAYDGSWGANSEETVRSLMQTYTGHPLYYSFERGDDVFIMVGVCQDYANFGVGGLQWLYETLEVNRNKRCFVFQHIRPDDACGNAYGIYKNDIWNGTQSIVFESLLKHYRNAIFFHGHSHLKFNLQSKTNLANIDTKYGRYSVHIPSLSVPRTGNLDGTGKEEVYADSEGYVVDVYENGIRLRGRDFKNRKFIPIASYWLSTTLQTVKAGTYTDPTGTIAT